MIIKGFEGIGIELNSQEFFRIQWDYISLPTGQEIGPKSFNVPDNLITEEWLLAWDLTNDLPLYIDVDAAVLNPPAIPIAWYTDTFWLSYYFTAADQILGADFSLKLPNAYQPETSGPEPITQGQLFKSRGKNYPGQSVAGKQTISKFPGLNLGPGPAVSDAALSISDCITNFFTKDLAQKETQIRNAWQTDFGPNSGSEFSFNMFGLDREDYRFLQAFPRIKDAVVSTLPITTGATNYLYLAIEPITGIICYSLNSITDFKFGTVTSPADLELTVIDYTQTLETFIPIAQPIYFADNTEGYTLAFTSASNQLQNVVLSEDRYQPEIIVEAPILASEFVPGFRYKFLQNQASFPVEYISTGPNTGRYPATGIRLWNIKPMPFGVFNGKNTRHACEFFFRLYRLRRGRAYDQAQDKINTGPEDFEQLLLWHLPTSIVEPANPQTENAFVADSILGSTNNEVCVRLPFSYKREGTEWNLAHNICKAFLQNYTIGYHEFVADFSAAGEPAFSPANA